MQYFDHETNTVYAKQYGLMSYKKNKQYRVTLLVLQEIKHQSPKVEKGAEVLSAASKVSCFLRLTGSKSFFL